MAPRISTIPLIAGANVLIFLAALASFEWAVGRVASPFQAAEKVEKKFAYYAAHRDDYDFVFVGSSRVMNQLSPKVFDAQMAAAGRPCRSFNLGVAAMFLPECSFLIDQIRALHPRRLRGMVIELSDPAPRHDAEHPLTERDIYWHHLGPTALACAAVWTDPDWRAATPERVAQVWLQTTIFARCLLHLGAGPPLLESIRKRPSRHGEAKTLPREVIGPDGDGFVPLAHTLGQGQAGVAKTGGSTPDLEAFQRSLAGLLSTPGPEPHALALSILRDHLARSVRDLARDGIRPYFFIGPGTTREAVFVGLRADGTLPTLFAFNDPQAHPDLYALEVRADRNHLNAAGAERLSRQLAQAVAAADRERK